MKLPMILSFSGRKGSGKNTIADHAIAKYGYRPIAWADALRHEVAYALDLFKWDYPMTKDGYPEWLIQLIDDAYGEVSYKGKYPNTNIPDMYTYVYTKPTPTKLRILIQRFGTEFRRTQDPSYWLKSLNLKPSQKYVVTDTRFQNEVDLLTVFGSLNIMVEAFGFPEQEKDDHVSEKMDLKNIDYTISNIYGDPTDMFKQLDCIIETVESHNIEKLALIEWNKNAD